MQLTKQFPARDLEVVHRIQLDVMGSCKVLCSQLFYEKGCPVRTPHTFQRASGVDHVGNCNNSLCDSGHSS